ncbi:MAG: hypothetical protein HY815_06455, partial [Candidatus Riflebacteria bacterium]|nr:hypothetical protein [Candidatus Riflebacteria bacterium]
MRCEEVQETLERRGPGMRTSLAPEVLAHVDGCSECREFASDLDFVAAAFVHVPEERFPEAKS